MSGEICDACGERNPPGSEFCPACGMYLGWGERAPADEAGSTSTATVSGSSGKFEDTLVRSPAPANDSGQTDPALAVVGPVPVVTAPVVPPPASHQSLDIVCPTCGRFNGPQRRFCSKCGYFFGVATDAQLRGVPARTAWWRRLLPRRRPAALRAARAAYRRSLPLRYRATRAIGVLAVLGIVAGGFAVAQRSPLAWAKDHWADVRGTQEAVPAVTAIADPANCAIPGVDYAPAFAVDGSAATAWAREWSPTAVPSGQCDVTLGGALLLELNAVREVVAIEILAGLPAGDPLTGVQWRPKTLELRFTDGTSQEVSLEQTPEPQVVSIDAVNTGQVRIAVIEAYPPADGNERGKLAISEVTVRARPLVN